MIVNSKEICLQADQTIAFDGDSLTALRSKPGLDQWPWLRISNSHRSWADVFSELMFAWRPELNLTFRTTAIGGSTCHDLQARFADTIQIIKPDWIFMTIGGNDANHGIAIEEYESALEDYIWKVQAWGGNVVFLYNVQPCPHARSTTKHKKRQPYYAVQESLSANRDNVYLIDLGPGMVKKAQALYEQSEFHNIYSDGNHFSNLGAMIIAGEVLQACGILK